MGRFMAFVSSPIVAINRITSEPPCHQDCAQFAVKHCPFMTRPKMKRNEQNLPGEYAEMPGVHVKRNAVLSDDDGFMFNLGDPLNDRMVLRRPHCYP
jgi:hypothetical protein